MRIKVIFQNSWSYNIHLKNILKQRCSDALRPPEGDEHSWFFTHDNRQVKHNSMHSLPLVAFKIKGNYTNDLRITTVNGYTT